MARRSLILAAALAAACGTNDDTAPVALRVTLSSPSVAVGRTVLATAAGIDRDGDLVALPGLTWSTSRPDLATVDANGTVTGLAVGDVEVQATTGALSATATLHVALDPTAACRLRGPARGIGLGIPRIEGRLPSTGSVHVVVLLVDFSDAVATRAPRDVFAMISPAAEQRFAALSYGRMRMFLDPVLVWLRMSKPSTAYGWPTLSYADQKAYLQEAVQLAGGRLASTQPSAVVVLANPDASALSYGPAFTANPGEGILVNGQVVDNGATSGADLLAWGSGWLNHELGHTLSLVDLYELDAMPEAQFHYTGDFSLMGNILGVGAEYLGWERWVLGWLDNDAVVCAGRGVTQATLAPIESDGGGVKLLVVPTSARTAVVVESRRALGDDVGLRKPGALVYAVDVGLASGHGVVKVLPIDDRDVRKLSAPLALGESVTYGGVTVTADAPDALGDHVEVRY